MPKQPHTHCKRCSNPYSVGTTKLCTNCLEVESRLGLYLESPIARQHVIDLLDTYIVEDTDEISQVDMALFGGPY